MRTTLETLAEAVGQMHRQVLLIWQEIPENTTTYFFPDVTEEEYEKMLKAHGKYENTIMDDPEDVAWLNDWLGAKGGLEACKINGPFVSVGPITVIVSGYVM